MNWAIVHLKFPEKTIALELRYRAIVFSRDYNCTIAQFIRLYLINIIINTNKWIMCAYTANASLRLGRWPNMVYVIKGFSPVCKLLRHRPIKWHDNYEALCVFIFIFGLVFIH